MAVYKRVSCPSCNKKHELRNDEDKLKRKTCVRCGNDFEITPFNFAYYIDYSYDQKRFRERIGPVSKKVAEIALGKKLVEIAEGRFVVKKKEQKNKFSDFCDEFIDSYAKTNILSWKRSMLPNLKSLKKFMGDRYLTDITPQVVERYKTERLSQVSPAATNRALTLLKSMFNRAIEWKKFDGINPVSATKFLREDNHKERYLDKDEIKRLLDNCDDFLRPMIIVAINTGMRRGEIFGLKWTDIDFNARVIHLLKTKNGKKRQVPMNDKVIDALNGMIKHITSDYVFCTKTGKPFMEIRKPFMRSLERANVTHCRFHDLRHTFASHLMMSGVNPNTLCELMGHKSIRMTMKYAHLAKGHLSDAVKVLSGQFDTLGDSRSNVATPRQTSDSQTVDVSLV